MNSNLGVGYSSNRQVYLSNCVAFNESHLSITGNPESTLTFVGVSSYTEMTKDLGLDLSAHTRIDLEIGHIDIDDSISYTEHVKETDYSKSFIFNVKARFGNLGFEVDKYGEDALTQEAALIYKSSIGKFLEICGDQFTIQEALGASLYISTKLDFPTRVEKDTFSIHSGIILGPVMSFFMLEAGKGLNKFFESNRASVSIAVLQKGGDLKALQKMFPDLGFSGGLAIYNCLNRDGDIYVQVEKCKDVMNQLFDYASNVFPNSVQDKNLAAVLNNYQMNYKTIGLSTSSSQVPDDVLQIRKHLKELYEDFTNQQLFLTKLLQPMSDSYMQIDGVQVGWKHESIKPDILQELQVISTTLSDSVKKVKELDNICYDNIDQCKDFNVVVDLSIMETFKQSYLVKTKCNSEIFGPRYMLAIGKDLYREDSKFPDQSSQGIIMDYTMAIIDKETISVEFGNCRYSLTRDSGYTLVDAYHAVFSGECAKMICPADRADNIVEALFILTETPI